LQQQSDGKRGIEMKKAIAAILMAVVVMTAAGAAFAQG